MSAADADDDDGGSASARDQRAVRPRGGRADAARRLSQRPHAACLADRRPARHRQGDAGLSHGALRARASRSGAPDGAERRRRSRSPPTIRSRGASRRRRTPTSWCSSARSTRRPASCAPRSGSTTCAARCRSSARPRARAAGASASSTPPTSCNPQGANALLKILEEPPRDALLLLVSHAPGAAAADHPLALPPAARCAPLPADDGARRRCRARSAATPDDAELARAAGAGRGQRRPRAALLDGAGARPARSACRRCSSACRRSIRARCTRSATRLAGTEPQRLRQPSSTPSTPGSPRSCERRRRTAARLARPRRGLGQGQPAPRATPTTYNLDRKPLVFASSAGLPRRRAVDADRPLRLDIPAMPTA